MPQGVLAVRIVRARVHENGPAPHALALLRKGHARPKGRCAAEERDELAPLQLMETHPLPLTRATV